MSLKIKQSVQGFNSFFSKLKHCLSEIVQRAIEDQLDHEVSQWLYRDYHQRRSTVNGQPHVATAFSTQRGFPFVHIYADDCRTRS